VFHHYFCESNFFLMAPPSQRTYVSVNGNGSASPVDDADSESIELTQRIILSNNNGKSKEDGDDGDEKQAVELSVVSAPLSLTGTNWCTKYCTKFSCGGRWKSLNFNVKLTLLFSFVNLVAYG